jgi:hypothetical protein
VLGDPGRYEANVVPRDFVADALAHLSRQDGSEGETYHLVEPSPPTVREAVRVLGRAADRTLLPVPVHGGLAKRALERSGRLRSATGMDPELVNYFTHPTRYTPSNAVRDLRGTGVEAPPFRSYADTLVAFVRDHPDVGSEGMT